MNARPFDNAAQVEATPFGGTPATAEQPQAQAQAGVGSAPDIESDPISTLLGVAVEGFVDEVTFGIWQPDIVPEWQEREQKWASTVGRISGNIAGFLPAIAMSGGVGKVAIKSAGAVARLAAFPFGRKLISTAAASAGASKFGSLAIHAGRTMTRTGTAFAVHDVAREFVEQYKQEDPDAYELGKAAAVGFVQGGIFGTVSGSFSTSSPVNMLVANAGAMVGADAVYYAANGEDITKEKLAQSFLLGTIMALPSLRGLKKRRIWQSEKVLEQGNLTLIELNNPKSNVRATLAKHIGIAKEEVPEVLVRSVKISKQANTISRMIEGFDDAINLQKQSGGARGALRGLKDKMKIDDNTWIALLGDASGGRATSSKHLTAGEAKTMLNNVLSTIDDGMNAAKAYREQLGMPKLENAVQIYTGSAFTPIQVRLAKIGLADMLKDSTVASRLMDIERTAMGHMVDAAVQKFEASARKGILETAATETKAFVTNKPTGSMKYLRTLLEMPAGPELTRALNQLPKAQREAFGQLRSVLNYYWARTNEVRHRMGLKQIPYRDGYMRLLTKDPRSIFESPTMEQIGKGAPKERPRDVFNPTAETRTGRGQEINLGRDLVARPIKNAMYHDLKQIYLHEPALLVDAQVKYLRQSNAITNAEEKYIIRYINDYILGAPKDWEKTADNAFKSFLKGTHIEGFLNTVFKPLGREISDRPLRDAVSMLGTTISRGMIAGRPALALRNLIGQQFYPLGLGVSVKNNAKASLWSFSNRMPEELKKMTKEIDEYIISMQRSHEGARAGGVDVFSKAHMTNVRTSALAAYFQTIDNIKKGIKGFADDAGRAARKKNPNAISQGERNIIKKEIAHMISGTQFIYHLTGLPGVFNNMGGRMAFKLQSFPMNYMFNYLDESVYRMANGRPSWDKTGSIKLPMSQRLGLVKHFAAATVLINGMYQLGMDYSNIVGASLVPEKEADHAIGGGWGVKLGVFNYRPSPGLQVLLGMSDMMSSGEYAQEKGKRTLMSTLPAMTVPGYLAMKDVYEAYKTGDPGEILFRKKWEKETGGSNAVHGFGSFSYFKPFQARPFNGG